VGLILLRSSVAWDAVPRAGNAASARRSDRQSSYDHHSDVGAIIFSGEASEVLVLPILLIPNLLVFLCVIDIALIVMRQVHVKDERNP
jgi:hypothetical protein